MSLKNKSPFFSFKHFSDFLRIKYNYFLVQNMALLYVKSSCNLGSATVLRFLGYYLLLLVKITNS